MPRFVKAVEKKDMRHLPRFSKPTLFLVVWISFLTHVYCHGEGPERPEHGRERERHPADHDDEPKQAPPPPQPQFSYMRPPPPMGTVKPNTQTDTDQCPCILKPGTKECMMYDQRYAASTIEKAILNFPDLQISGSSITGTSGGGESQILAGTLEVMPPPPESVSSIPPVPLPTPQDLQSGNPVDSTQTMLKSRVGSANGNVPTTSDLCANDAECAECSAILLNRLEQLGCLHGDELTNVSRKFGFDNTTTRRMQNSGLCQKYRFSKDYLAAPDKATQRNGSEVMAAIATAAAVPSTDPELDALLQKLREKGEQKWKERQEKLPQYRKKRQSIAKNVTATIGQQFKIDCSKRGDPVETGSAWIGLCNVCWAWRKLPATYFPQYVNELVCNTDTKCMSGFGSCQQRYKSIDILQNTGTDAAPVWKQVTVSVANYCDCEVESGSSLHNFVAA